MGDWVRVKPPKEVKLIYVVRIQYAHISQKQNTHTIRLTSFAWTPVFSLSVVD